MDNTVGSLEPPQILFARKNLELRLSKRQREILVGCILGDAYIASLGKVRIEHSVKQREYVDWKHEELHSLCYLGGPRTITHTLLTQPGKEYKAIFFLLRQYFRPWRAIFYRGREKIFPENLKLSPLSLAVWYMDDGCWTGKKCVISTESFKGKYGTFLRNALWQQFAIESIIGKNGKLAIRKRSHKIFYRLISPHIISSMKYKLPNPVTTQSFCERLEFSERKANTLAPKTR